MYSRASYFRALGYKSVQKKKYSRVPDYQWSVMASPAVRPFNEVSHFTIMRWCLMQPSVVFNVLLVKAVKLVVTEPVSSFEPNRCTL
jgi:hypothetical protein